MRGRTVVAGAALALALAGCSQSKPTPTPPPAKPTTTTAPAPTPSPVHPPLHFDQTRTYPDGLTVTVKNVETFKPSRGLLAASGLAKDTIGVSYTVKVVNRTSTSYDANLMDAAVTFAVSGGIGAQALCDIANQVECGSARRIPPGHGITTHYAIAASPTDLGHIAVRLTPDTTHPPTVWLGTVQ